MQGHRPNDSRAWRQRQVQGSSRGRVRVVHRGPRRLLQFHHEPQAASPPPPLLVAFCPSAPSRHRILAADTRRERKVCGEGWEGSLGGDGGGMRALCRCLGRACTAHIHPQGGSQGHEGRHQNAVSHETRRHRGGWHGAEVSTHCATATCFAPAPHAHPHHRRAFAESGLSGPGP